MVFPVVLSVFGQKVEQLFDLPPETHIRKNCGGYDVGRKLGERLLRFARTRQLTFIFHVVTCVDHFDHFYFDLVL